MTTTTSHSHHDRVALRGWEHQHNEVVLRDVISTNHVRAVPVA